VYNLYEVNWHIQIRHALHLHPPDSFLDQVDYRKVIGLGIRDGGCRKRGPPSQLSLIVRSD